MKKSTYSEWEKGDINVNEFTFSDEDLRDIKSIQSFFKRVTVSKFYNQLVDQFDEHNDRSINPRKNIKNKIEWYSVIFEHDVAIDSLDSERRNIRYYYNILVSGSKYVPDLFVINNLESCYRNSPELKGVLEAEAHYDFFQFLKNKIKLKKSTRNKEIFTLYQQILVIYYLSKSKILDLNELHRDHTKQAKILHVLLNKTENNVYKAINSVFAADVDGKIFSTANIEKVKKYFEKTEHKEIITQIDSDLNLAKIRELEK